MGQQDSLLPVALDVMGGDHGSFVAVEGAVQAAVSLGIRSIVVGREEEIKGALRSLGAENNALISVQHAPDVVTMDDSPTAAIRSKANSSIRLAFELVHEGKASSVVSPGNTGAVMAAGVYVVGTIAGIARPAIASLIPKVGKNTPTVLLDSGANVDCNADQLVQFALMGSCYATSVLGCPRPRVALLSNGTEISKGTDIIRSAAVILSEIPDLLFVGYAEGRDISRDIADVVVCDGFVGNVMLKAMEGTVELVFESIRHQTENSWRGMLGMAMAKPMIKQLFREKLDPSSYGGAPLLGLNAIAIICHGSSKSRAILNGIRVARKFADDKLVDEIGLALAKIDQKMPGSHEDSVWSRMGQRFEKSRRRAEVKSLEPDQVVTPKKC